MYFIKYVATYRQYYVCVCMCVRIGVCMCWVCLFVCVCVCMCFDFYVSACCSLSILHLLQIGI